MQLMNSRESIVQLHDNIFRTHFEPYADNQSEPSHNSDCYAVLDEGFRERILKLYESILEYQAKAARHLSQPVMWRTRRNLQKVEEWRRMLEKTQRLDVECKEYRNVFVHAIQQKQLDNLSQRFQKQQQLLDHFVSRSDMHATNVRKVLYLISDIFESQDHEDIRSRLGRPYWQSGQWLLLHPDFQIWELTASTVLWLQGPVGVGKTCLTSTVIEHVLGNARVPQEIAFFYCSQRTCKAVEVLRSVLCQLSKDWEGDLAKPTQNWFEHHTGQTINSTFEISIDPRTKAMCSLSSHACLELIKDIAKSTPNITLVIDAVDECEDVSELLRFLKYLMDEIKHIRLFLSSRSGVRGDFESDRQLEISHFDSSADIKAFIDREIQSPRRRARSGMTLEQAAELQKILIARAKGM